MRIHIDTKEVDVHIQNLAKMKPTVKRELWLALRITTIDLMRFIKHMMPVDTGRARASWGQWSSSDLIRANPEARPSDAVYNELPERLETVQGSNVPYIKDLNEGSSQQAPAGFIDLGNEKARRQLWKLGNAIVKRVKP